jgi:signal peptidase I
MRSTRLLACALLATILAGTVGIGAHFWERGYRVYVIHTGSMMPTFNPGGVVIDRPPGKLHVGEAITFRHSDLSTDLVTHRLKAIQDGALITKGDANPTADPWRIRPDQVRGAVSSYVPDLGYVLIFFKQRAGVAAVMTAAISVILLWSLFFPGGLSDPTSTVVREVIDTSADASRGGINRLRGNKHTHRAEPGAIDRLRAKNVAPSS